MPSIRPFRALRPASEYVRDAHIYHGDAGDAVRARDKAINNPNSMLQVSRVDLLLSPEESKDESLVRQESRKNLQRFIDDGVLIQDESESFYLYRLSLANHSQTGIVTCLDVTDYINGTIKRHELTRMDKIHVQERLIERVGGNMEPVILVYDANLEREHLLEEAPNSSPIKSSIKNSIKEIMEDWTDSHDSTYDFLDAGGIRHELWAVNDGDTIAKLQDAFSPIDSLYICDGHHRIAASADYYVENEDALNDSPTTPDTEAARKELAEKSKFFMGVIFPSDEMLIMDYNRAVKDLHGLTESEFFDELRSKGFSIEEIGTEPTYPKNHGEYTMVMDNNWYRLNYIAERDTHDPVAGLDVSLLQNVVLRDILGIRDPQHDERISFISGTKGLEALQQATREDMKVAFAIVPPDMDDIMRVSDSGLTMPPKSTCFEPKVVSGILVYKIQE